MLHIYNSKKQRMMKVYLNKIFIITEDLKKNFLAEFKDSINIVYGRNTSGKSTLLQLILYCFGINEDRQKLSDILSEKIICRIDIEINDSPVQFVRSDDTIHIRQVGNPIKIFTGVNSNNSVEHVKLKNFIHQLFDFDLELESKFGMKSAPIETIFLPYYISQSVGWIYLRNSFNNLEFFKNFKEDYLDYYLGIGKTEDRDKKKELENELDKINAELNILLNFEKDNEDLVIARMTDENHRSKAENYIEVFKDKQSQLLKLENEYVNKSNEMTFYKQRISVISKVKRNTKNQQPSMDSCPTCTQTLPSSIETIYNYFQNENDTEKQLETYKEKSTILQSNLNSLEKKIYTIKEEIEEEFEVYKKYENQKITFEKWLNQKIQIRLGDNIQSRIGELTQAKEKVKEELKKHKSDDQIELERKQKEYLFEDMFKENLRKLNVSELTEDRFLKLYSISSFPYQGVELLKTVMSFHFAFNRIITETPSIHRLPFILDGIFKEDVDGTSKKKILTFINKNRPKDTQTIFTIANAKEDDISIDEINKQFFNSNANCIVIGEAKEQRSILIANIGTNEVLIADTMEILEQV